MSLASRSLGLPREALDVLALLSNRDPVWAVFEPGAQRPDITIKTNYYGGNLEGFMLRMWPSLHPQGPCATFIVGCSHVRPLTVEAWGELNLPWGETPWDISRPANAIEVYVGTDVAKAADTVETGLHEAYTRMRAEFKHMPLSLRQLLNKPSFKKDAD